jgi:hypothetical protein
MESQVTLISLHTALLILYVQLKSEMYIHFLYTMYTSFLFSNYSFCKSVRISTLCMTQVIFPTIVYRQIISLITHCITIPVGQKFTYTKLTVPLNGGVPVDVFQGLPSNSVPTCLTSWDNQKRSSKTSIVDLHMSGSSLGAISKCLKVPRSSV